MKLLPAITVAIVIFAAAHGDSCAQFTTCMTCAGINNCGWCSSPIQYANGSAGANCASPQSTEPFTCDGIYSTNQCIQGYVCDQASGACRLADPGQGTDFDTCNAACTVGPIAKVYGCLPGTHSCVVVPPGTPGAGSMSQCEAQCIQPAAQVYACNVSSQLCVKVPPGTPNASSKLVCEAHGCDIGTYACDLNTYQCSPTGGAMSNSTCTADCRPANDPCSVFTTCETCIAGGAECGWCSTNVTYVSGQVGGQCAGVRSDILPFNCQGTYSTKSCLPTPAPVPSTPSPTQYPLPPGVPCKPGQMVLLQYNCANSECNGCNTGTAAMCQEPHCTYYCSGLCQPVPAFDTSFMWSCNINTQTGIYTNATLVHFLDSDQCVGPVNPPGTGGSGTYPLNDCASPTGPNIPPQYNTFVCVPCGDDCTG